MSNDLSALEEFDAQMKIEMPHLLYEKSDLISRKKVAYIVLAKKENEILLINPAGFCESSVIAGLNEKNIEYFAKFAPREYKESLALTISNDFLVEDVLEISKAMDDDYGKSIASNQQRIRNVFKYIEDNKVVFYF